MGNSNQAQKSSGETKNQVKQHPLLEQRHAVRLPRLRKIRAAPTRGRGQQARKARG